MAVDPACAVGREAAGHNAVQVVTMWCRCWRAPLLHFILAPLETNRRTSQRRSDSIHNDCAVESLRGRWIRYFAEDCGVCSSGYVGQISPRGVGDLLLALNAVDSTRNAAPRKAKVATGNRRGDGSRTIGNEDRVEQLGEALTANGHALHGGQLNLVGVGG